MVLKFIKLNDTNMFKAIEGHINGFSNKFYTIPYTIINLGLYYISFSLFNTCILHIQF